MTPEQKWRADGEKLRWGIHDCMATALGHWEAPSAIQPTPAMMGEVIARLRSLNVLWYAQQQNEPGVQSNG